MKDSNNTWIQMESLKIENTARQLEWGVHILIQYIHLIFILSRISIYQVYAPDHIWQYYSMHKQMHSILNHEEFYKYNLCFVCYE